MESKNDYEAVAAKVQEGGRKNVGIVILGRGESKEKVEHWIKEGRDVKGIIGFAVGRTMFSQPLIDFTSGRNNINLFNWRKDSKQKGCYFFKYSLFL